MTEPEFPKFTQAVIAAIALVILAAAVLLLGAAVVAAWRWAL